MKDTKETIRAAWRKEIGEKIREARIKNNLSQNQLAKIVEMPQSYLSKIESGENETGIGTIGLICSAMAMTIDIIRPKNSYNPKTFKNAETMNAEDIKNYIKENNLKSADGFVFGFETYGDAEDFANRIDSEVVEIKKRDGQNWRHMSYTSEAFDLKPEMFGDDYDIISSGTNVYKEYIKPRLEDIDDLDDAQELIEKYQDLADAVEDLDDGGCVLACNDGDGIFIPVESYPAEVMEYSFDVYSYAIAVKI